MKISNGALTVGLLCTLAAPTWAASGIVTLDFGGNTTDAPKQVVIGPGDSVYADLTLCGMFVLSADGKLSSTFGTGGRLSLERCAQALSVEPDGSFFALEQGDGARLRLRDAVGVELSVSAGLAPAAPLKALSSVVSFMREPGGQFVVAGVANTGCNNCFVGQLARFTAGGSPDTSFAPPFLEGAGDSELRFVRVLPAGKIVASVETRGFSPRAPGNSSASTRTARRI